MVLKPFSSTRDTQAGQDAICRPPPPKSPQRRTAHEGFALGSGFPPGRRKQPQWAAGAKRGPVLSLSRIPLACLLGRNGEGVFAQLQTQEPPSPQQSSLLPLLGKCPWTAALGLSCHLTHGPHSLIFIPLYNLSPPTPGQIQKGKKQINY